jgi:predicted exporter
MTQQGYRRVCTAALALLTLVALFCFVSIQRNGLHIDTNLRSLSPSFAVDAAVNQALNKMSAQTAQQFMLVLAHPDEDLLAEASDALRELIENDASAVRYVDHSALLDAYVAQLKQHPFHILGVQAQQALTQQPLTQQAATNILRLGESNLYGSGGALRLLPLQNDPLGFANEYAVGLLDRLALTSGDEVQAVQRGDEAIFIAAHALQISSDALEMQQQDLALARINQFITQLNQQYPEVDILRSGILFFAADAAQSARADVQTISTGSTIGVLLLILWVFRGVRALLLPALSIGMGLAFAFSICHFWFGSVHVLTLVFGSSLIGVVVDYALHFYYFQAHHAHSENRLPLYRALFLSLLTSVIGFSALAWSGLAALQQVAIFAALGLIYAWLMVIAVGHYLTRGVKVYDSRLQKMVRTMLRLFGKVPSRLIVPALVLLLSGGFFLTGFSLPVSDSPRSFFAANPQLVAQEKQISEWVASHEPASFIIVQGESTQQVYERIDAVQTLIGTQGKPLLGVQQFFPSPAQQQRNYELNQHLYTGNALVQQFIQQHELTEIAANELSLAYAQQNNQLLNPADFFDDHELALPPLWIQDEDVFTALLLLPKGHDTDSLAATLGAIEGARFFSAMQESEMAMKVLRQSAMELLLLALLLMALLLFTRYHWKKMLQLIAIPVFAVSASFILLALLNIPLTLFHVMALFLVVGLGMDYVIFIAEMAENTVETLSAVAISSTTNLLSFGLLSLSILPAVSAFGIALFIGSCLNLTGALMLASRNQSLRT